MKQIIMPPDISYSPPVVSPEDLFKYQDLVARRSYWVEQYGGEDYKNLVMLYEDNLCVPLGERIFPI